MGGQSTLSLLPYPDKPLLLEEVRVQKQLFLDRLNEMSEGLKEKGERWGWPCPHSGLHIPPELRRRAECSQRPFPDPPLEPPSLPMYWVPVHSFSYLHFLLTPQPLLALAASTAPQFLSHLTWAACNNSCGEYLWGPGIGEG